MQADDVDPARFDHVVNNFAELGRFVRFGDDAAESEILITAHRRVGRVTAGNDPGRQTLRDVRRSERQKSLRNDWNFRVLHLRA